MAAKAWQEISQGLRDGWNTYASDHPVTNWTGTPERLTGMNWFVRCWINTYRAVSEGCTVAPIIPAPNPIVGLARTKPDNYIQVAWTTPTAAPERVDLWFVGPLSAGIAVKIERVPFLQLTAAENFGGIILLNSPAVGRYTIFARSLDYSSGLVSTWVSKYLDVA